MALSGVFAMDPSALNASIKSAFPKSVTLAKASAIARLHNKSKSGVRSRVVSSTQGMLIGTGLATTFEHGRQGGYEINAGGDTGVRRSFSRKTGEASFSVRAGRGGGLFLGFNSNGGSSGTGVRYGPVKGGPMRPYPAMGPASEDWARKIYPQVAKAALATAGFSLASALRKSR